MRIFQTVRECRIVFYTLHAVEGRSSSSAMASKPRGERCYELRKMLLRGIIVLVVAVVSVVVAVTVDEKMLVVVLISGEDMSVRLKA